MACSGSRVDNDMALIYESNSLITEIRLSIGSLERFKDIDPVTLNH